MPRLRAVWKRYLLKLLSQTLRPALHWECHYACQSNAESSELQDSVEQCQEAEGRVVCSPALAKMGSGWLKAASEGLAEAAPSAQMHGQSYPSSPGTNTPIIFRQTPLATSINSAIPAEHFSLLPQHQERSPVLCTQECHDPPLPAFSRSLSRRLLWRFALSASSFSCPPHFSSARVSTCLQHPPFTVRPAHIASMQARASLGVMHSSLF